MVLHVNYTIYMCLTIWLLAIWYSNDAYYQEWWLLNSLFKGKMMYANQNYAFTISVSLPYICRLIVQPSIPYVVHWVHMVYGCCRHTACLEKVITCNNNVHVPNIPTGNTHSQSIIFTNTRTWSPRLACIAHYFSHSPCILVRVVALMDPSVRCKIFINTYKYNNEKWDTPG